MRLVTMKQWDAFGAVLREIQEATGKMAPITEGLTVLVANTDPTDPAQEAIPINAMRAGLEMMRRLDELLERFEVMVAICLGEKRKPGESLQEFRDRIAALDEVAILGAMARNGVRLVGRG